MSSTEDVKQRLTLDWRRAVGAVDRSAGATTIVVPVYGALEDSLCCIHSVLTAKRDAPAHLVVIDDCSPDDAVHEALRHASDDGRLFTLWRNAANQGFVGTVNRGILAAPGDVVVLNSDTLVTDGWLDRMLAVARQDEAIASVSPMTNNATILSYPKINAANVIPHDTSLAELAAMFAENTDCCESVATPVNVGFCMLLTWRSVATLGGFDEALFGIGYGEECDWCMRANALGFKHAIATDVFVFHAGSVSFSDRAARRQELAARSLTMRHPDYWQMIGHFCAADPLLAARRTVDVRRLTAAAARQKGIVVHVLHRLGGGTRVHAMKLAELLEQEGYGSIFIMPDEVGRAAISASFVADLDNLFFNCANDLLLLRKLFAALSPLVCHVHALIGFSREATDFVREIAARKVVTLHDYVTICPQITLLNENGTYCDLPPHTRCNSCLRLKPSPIACQDIGRWRRDWYGLLRDAERVLAPSRFVAEAFQRVHPTLAIEVVPHDVGVPRMLPAVVRRVRGDEVGPPGPREVAVLGNMNHHKGIDVVVACAANARDADLALRFLIFGQAPGVTDDYGGRLLLMGRYDHAELPARIAESGCEIGFLPSIWPETFSYVLSEMIELGLHPVAFDLGAPADRLRHLGLGTLLPLGMSAPTLNAALLAIAVPGEGGASLAPQPSAGRADLDRADYLNVLYGANWRRPPLTDRSAEVGR